jgi:hypothetical protein
VHFIHKQLFCECDIQVKVLVYRSAIVKAGNQSN